MTIDEAISHAEEVAERQEYLSTQNHGYCEEKRNVEAREQCAECAAEHRQLVEWLMELKEAKRLLEMALCELNNGTCTKFCSTCTRVSTEECLVYKKKYRWIHTAEALKLIGETNADQ